MKLSKKVSLILTLVLIIGLGVLCSIIGSSMKNVMVETTKERMEETVLVRSKIVENYVLDAEDFLASYAQSSDIISALKDPSDHNLEVAQEYTLRYASTNSRLENIYLGNTQTVVLASMVTPVIGKQLREGEALTELTSKVFAGNEVYNIGVMTSMSTGVQVLSMYYPVYDEHSNPIGYVGMALKAEDLLVTLSQLEFVGLKDCSYTLLDVVNGLYISSADEALNGTEISDPNLKDIIHLVEDSTTSNVFQKEYEDSQTGKIQISVCNYISDRGWIFMVNIPKERLYERISKLTVIFILVGAGILAVGVVIIFIVTTIALKGVEKVATEMKTIASLDISENTNMNKYHQSKNEVGIIANATQNLTKELRGIVGGLKDNSSELMDRSKYLNQLFNHSRNMVEQIEQAIQDIANGAVSQSEETQQASESVVHIGVMVEELGEETKRLYDSSHEMTQISTDVVSTLEVLKDINEKTEQSVNQIYKQTNLTNESVSKIQEAISIIASIADETSLLSLNASIEAARAGEQGRGFAVVATQIKKLAEQSNASAACINEILVALMKDSQAAVEIMEEVQENVRQQSDHMVKTIDAFDVLKAKIVLSIKGIDAIKEKALMVDKVRADVVDRVMNLSAIAQQSAASTEETSASVTIMNCDMLEIAKSAKALSDMASSIDARIAEFKME